MSSINTDYAIFDVVDYKNAAVLSSYNLSITPLTFKARIPTQAYLSGLSNAKALYDFGDGTVGNGLTSQHVYQVPGLYNVKMVLRDSANNAVLASYSADVQIYDYLENTQKGSLDITPWLSNNLFKTYSSLCQVIKMIISSI